MTTKTSQARSFILALLLVCPPVFSPQQRYPVKQVVINELQICGYHRISLKTILAKVKSRPGDRYNEEQVKQDFAEVLSLGFDTKTSKFIVKNGPQNGKIIIFNLTENEN